MPTAPGVGRTRRRERLGARFSLKLLSFIFKKLAESAAPALGSAGDFVGQFREWKPVEPTALRGHFEKDLEFLCALLFKRSGCPWVQKSRRISGQDC